MEKMIFTAEESSFIVEAEGKKLRVSYEEFHGEHEDAMAFCKGNNGGDESVENMRFLAKHKDVINEELRKLGKTLIDGWYWTTELSWRNEECAFVVYSDDGDVRDDGRYGKARAVSAFHFENFNFNF